MFLWGGVGRASRETAMPPGLERRVQSGWDYHYAGHPHEKCLPFTFLTFFDNKNHGGEIVRKAIFSVFAILALLGLLATSISATCEAQSADLGVTMAVDNQAPNEGDTITYTITMTNSGPDNATNIEVTDILPAGLAYVSNSPSQGSYNGASGVWAVGSLANGANATLNLMATVDPGTGDTTATNTADITHADQSDPVSANNSSSESKDVIPAAAQM